MPMDIAPFAVKRDRVSTNCFRFVWEEPRNISRVVLNFAASAQAPGDAVKVFYRQHRWPEVRPENMGSGAAGSGWRPVDDWFNGCMKEADIRASVFPEKVEIAFAPIAEKEFPEQKDFNVAYRRTLELRVVLAEGSPDPAGIAVLTDTELERRDIVVLFGCERADESCWDGEAEVYNGILLEAKPLDSRSVVKILGPGRWECALRKRADGVRLSLLSAKPALPASNDDTIVTIRTLKESFSFRMADLLSEGFILAPDLDVEVKMPSRRPREVLRPQTRSKCIYDRVKEMPEQTWPRAWAALPPKLPLPFALGCETRRQKFRLQPNGDVECPGNFVRRVPAPDTECVKGGWELAFHFGLDGWVRRGRFIEEDCLPIIHTIFGDGPISIEQTAVAVPLRRSILDAPCDSSEPVILMLRFTFGNDSCESRRAVLNICADTEGSGGAREADELRVSDDVVFCRKESGRWLRFLFDCGGRGTMQATPRGVVYDLLLGPDERHEITLKIPYVTLETEEDLRALRSKKFETEADQARRFWRDIVGRGAQLDVPEKVFRNFYRAQQTHIRIADDEEMGSRRVFTRVGCFSYGNFSNESCMIISALDRRGLHEEAARRLDTFIAYQGTVGLPGDFSDHDGVFYGSGGYEHGDYNQHHGWVLWCMGEHWRLTRDRQWLDRAAPAIVKGCDWVIRQRSRTKKTDSTGKRVLEYGFLPAGALEDVKDFAFWLSTNTFTWWGLASAASALLEAGHPEGARLAAEADAYAADLRAGFREALIRSPVVKLRDGTWIPHQPSRLYLRGRDFGWLRETLEGAIHMIPTRLLPPDSRQALWILKDFEDNRYISERFGYTLTDFEQWWFDRGGFSMQPNLHWFCEPYLMRDEPEHFLRAFFNGFASAFRPDTTMLVEHPLPELHGVWGDHFKTSDEAQATHWLRLMFCQESGEDLFIGRGMPRYWLRDGCRAALTDIVTWFGKMSVAYTSMADSGRICLELNPPLRNPPRRLFIRFRHPEKIPLKRMTVDGREWPHVEPQREWAVMPPPEKPVVIIAHY